MQKALVLKIGTIIGIVVLLIVALSMIRGVIIERQNWRAIAYSDIAKSLAGNQKIVGPVLIIPYNETTKLISQNAVTNNVEETTVKERKLLFVMPETLNVDGKVKTEERKRGIYSVPTYSADMNVKGDFNIPKTFPLANDKTEILWKETFVWISVSDNRGISSRPVLNWEGSQVDFTPGSNDNFQLKVSSKGGVSANVDNLTAGGIYNFAFDITVSGTERLDWVPSAKDMTVNLVANWPHPSFSGQFLPAERNITDKGFTSRWKVSHFASNAEDLMNTCAAGACDGMVNNTFGVEFMTPVDTYKQTERAVKYGLLFISLTFISFFLFETLKRLPIHPIQYGLVGVALALFFQLLISLSEHMAFALAYSIAASACVVLLGIYVSAVLKSMRRGIGFGGGLAALYATLYGLLQSEDNSLLLGSILIFSILASIMILTRKVDWYKVGLPNVTSKSVT